MYNAFFKLNCTRGRQHDGSAGKDGHRGEWRTVHFLIPYD